jgi:hypothetical protein
MRGAKKGELGDGFFRLLGPALFDVLLNTEDREIIQVSLVLQEYFQLEKYLNNGLLHYRMALNALALSSAKAPSNS